MDLNVTTRQDGRRTVIDVAGEIDIYTAPALRERIDQVIDEGNDHVVVDLNDVTFMDSTGLSVLIFAYQRLSSSGSVRLVCRRERILKVLRITGTDRIFRVYANQADALGQNDIDLRPLDEGS